MRSELVGASQHWDSSQSHIPQERIEEARTRRPLSAVIGNVIRLRRVGAEYEGICPFHDDHNPSLNVNDRKGVWICRACEAGGDAITFVQRFHGKSFAEAVAELASAPYEASSDRLGRQMREGAEEYANRGSTRWEPSADQRSRIRQAQEIARTMRPANGTLAERYLRSRGISVRIPSVLGFSPALYFSPAKRSMPALIALVHDGGDRQIAAQRIFLDPATAQKAEPRREAKRTIGPLHDGAVKLTLAGRVLGLAEGVETALSAAQVFQVPVWATLGDKRLASVKLPAGVEQVIIFADNGKDGRVDPVALKAAEAYDYRGVAAVIEAPDSQFGDWNDYFRAQRGVAA